MALNILIDNNEKRERERDAEIHSRDTNQEEEENKLTSLSRTDKIKNDREKNWIYFID